MPPKTDFETHERILICLYENRKTDTHLDLLKQFKDVSKDSIYERAAELMNKGFITIIYPSNGVVGYLDARTGETIFPNAEKNEYIKAKLTTDGIDYVRELVRKNKKGSIWSQVWSVAKVLFAILGGLAALFKLIEFMG